jgi:glycylpeptide N-tetradecanoyltransferase
MPNSKESKRAEKVSSDLPINSSSEEANDAKADGSKGKKSEPPTLVSSVSPNPAEGVTPQGVVDAIHVRIKEDHPELRDIDANKIQEMLEKLRLKDILESRSGLGGKNRKDISEHKVISPSSIASSYP